TVEQRAGYEAQIRELEQLGCEEIFKEQVSSVAQRPELNRVLEYVRRGDVLCVVKLDRLARSVRDLVSITEKLERKKVALRVLHLNLDTGTPTGKLMLNMLGAIAQFERELMLERQREGIAKAKREGKYRGRKPTARLQAPRIIELHKDGVGVSEIAHRLEIGR